MLFRVARSAPLYSSYALSFDPFRVGILRYALPRDSLTLIPRGTGVPFKACFDSSRVVAANKLHFLLRARCALIWFRLPPLRWLSPLSSFSVWLAPLAPLRVLRSDGSAAEKKSLFDTLVGT